MCILWHSNCRSFIRRLGIVFGLNTLNQRYRDQIENILGTLDNLTFYFIIISIILLLLLSLLLSSGLARLTYPVLCVGKTSNVMYVAKLLKNTFINAL